MLIGMVIFAKKKHQKQPIYINCCYPDCVNHLLKQNGFRIYSGIGNIGIIEMVLSSVLFKPESFRMLATHYHVQELMKGINDRKFFPKIWFNGIECESIAEKFYKIFLINGQELNSITSFHCIKLIDTIINHKSCVLHLPGPNGLIGGFPVTIKNGLIESIGTGNSACVKEESWNIDILKNEGLLFTKTRVCLQL